VVGCGGWGGGGGGGGGGVGGGVGGGGVGGGGGGGGYLVEVSISSSVWAMQAGRENERTIDSRTNDQK